MKTKTAKTASAATAHSAQVASHGGADMAHALSFLLSSDAASQRMDSRKPRFVVHVETDSDMSVSERFVELDAEISRSAIVIILVKFFYPI